MEIGERHKVIMTRDRYEKFQKYCEVSQPVTKVIFNPPATIVYWLDGSRTVVKAALDDEYDPQIGFAMAYLKKLLGDQYGYIKRYACKEYERQMGVKRDKEKEKIMNKKDMTANEKIEEFKKLNPDKQVIFVLELLAIIELHEKCEEQLKKEIELHERKGELYEQIIRKIRPDLNI